MTAGTPLTQEQRDEIVRRMKANEWPSVIAKDYNVSHRAVTNCVKKAQDRT